MNPQNSEGLLLITLWVRGCMPLMVMGADHQRHDRPGR